MRREIIAICLLVFAIPAFAEPPPGQDQPATEPTSPPPQAEPDRDPGFHKGAYIFSFTGGPTTRASNSFMNNERAYDENLRFQTILGTIPVFGNPPCCGTFSSLYNRQPITQFNYERALTDHLGAGFSLFYFSIRGTRQDILPGYRTIAPATGTPQNTVLPIPTEDMLFMSSGGLLQAVFHPLHNTFLDPYIAVRGGIEGHSGNAHPGSYPDPTRYDTHIRNGVGLAAGAALGLNVYMGRYFGFKFEATGLRQFLQSEMYSARTLDSTHFQIGFFVSLF